MQFFDAYSGPEAKAILSDEPDIALVFFDVVMETENSGLEVARWMREDLKNQFTHLVLRTSNRVKHLKKVSSLILILTMIKKKLDRTKLFATTFAALRVYRDIYTVE